MPYIDLFVEDYAHELFLKAVVKRVLEQEKKEAEMQVRSATGGHGRVLNEYRTYQALLRRGNSSLPDLIVVAVDANCSRPLDVRQEIEEETDVHVKERIVVACPNPHIERWYMADAEGFTQVIGKAPRVKGGKCERDYYKNALARTMNEAGHVTTLSGIEFADELVDAMDFFRAGKHDKALHAFLSDLRAAVKSL